MTKPIAMVFFGFTACAATVPVPPQAFDAGGWSLDAQFMDVMGSPYLLAHGLGVPVADATATASVPTAGTYRVWARTRNWAPGSPGRFRIAVNGKTLDKTFGAEKDVWDWEDGGVVELASGRVTVALRDLTGFDGRCIPRLRVRGGPEPRLARANQPFPLRSRAGEGPARDD